MPARLIPPPECLQQRHASGITQIRHINMPPFQPKHPLTPRRGRDYSGNDCHGSRVRVPKFDVCLPVKDLSGGTVLPFKLSVCYHVVPLTFTAVQQTCLGL
jgi:hypothetical protein